MKNVKNHKKNDKEPHEKRQKPYETLGPCFSTKVLVEDALNWTNLQRLGWILCFCNYLSLTSKTLHLRWLFEGKLLPNESSNIKNNSLINDFEYPNSKKPVENAQLEKVFVYR